ncbi:MAG: hypothetical protein EPN82_03300 [Bacteroidetes bacterium]|nr:MAG: hypothetical protein EPN82_03300 [Bacteroidota bacterium]
MNKDKEEELAKQNNAEGIQTTEADYTNLKNKYDKLFNELNIKVEKITSDIEQERKRIIEILAFFTAAMAFILSTINISQQFSFNDALFLLFSMGFILSCFLLAGHYIFNKTILNISKANWFCYFIYLIAILGIYLGFLILMTYLHKNL